MYTTVLSTKGQVVLPAELRSERKDKPGKKFSVILTGAGYELIEIPENPVKLLRGYTKVLRIPENALKKSRMRDLKHDLEESNL